MFYHKIHLLLLDNCIFLKNNTTLPLGLYTKNLLKEYLRDLRV